MNRPGARELTSGSACCNVAGVLFALVSLALASDVPPPPPGLEWKPPLTADDLGRKREGWYLTGLPLANYDPNLGGGLGARGYWYQNGERADPYFAYTPYRHRVFLQVFATTEGYQFHWLDWDSPYLGDTAFRLRAELIHAAARATNHYAHGSASVEPLSFPGSAEVFPRAKDYDAALAALRPDGTAYTLYDKFGIEWPQLNVRVEREALRGLVRFQAGFLASRAWVHPFGGQPVDARDLDGNPVTAVSATTRLEEDCAAGRVFGCDGGWFNQLHAGAAFDTRDFEPDPNSGVYLETSLGYGSRAMGNQTDFLRWLISARGFYSPFPRLADLVLAGRLTLLVQSDQTPFYAQAQIPFTETPSLGLGGVRTLRGFRAGRFVGPVMAAAQAELRWTFYRFELKGERFAVFFCPLLDLGRAFDRVDQLGLAGWRRGQGAGLRLSWNQATVFMADVGVSEEDAGVYLNFNHAF